MELNRLRLSAYVSGHLASLNVRTGLTPNILCRIGFCLSIEDPTVPHPEDYPGDTDREIDRHTLTGPWDRLFVALLRERCHRDGLALSDEVLVEQFRAHINRGVLLLSKRVRSLQDLGALIPY
jgi:DNA sulfur modification protein DndE